MDIYCKISKNMNVLILTPDAVGSTLLQRLITIYMQFHQYDKPVINLHELTNGLTRYFNNHFDQDVLGAHPNLGDIIKAWHKLLIYCTVRIIIKPVAWRIII